MFTSITLSTILKGSFLMRKYSLQQLFTRFGFLVEEHRGELICTQPSSHNQQLFTNIMHKLTDSSVDLCTEMTEEQFIHILQPFFREMSPYLYTFEKLPVDGLDLYVAGLVAQLNRLGLRTSLSCEGHGSRLPLITFYTDITQRKVRALFQQMFQVRLQKGLYGTEILCQKTYLPEMAQRLGELSPEQATEIYSASYYEMPKSEYADLTETLLSINGASGQEEHVRTFIVNELEPLMDSVTVDSYGNVCAEKYFGRGSVVLLNAHMDTVLPFEPGRVIVKEGDVWSSSAGILGADDRAGMAAVLAATKTVCRNRDFCGTLKVIFTVEEEIGLCGAKQVSEAFTHNVDMAFVVDRRGNSDFVTSNYSMKFCTEPFETKLSRIGHTLTQQYNRAQWKPVVGGSSDTAIWAQRGINSVNISAGYSHEHSEFETLNVADSYHSYQVLLELIAQSRYLSNAYLQRQMRQVR